MSMMTWELWLAREVIVDRPLDISKIENKVKLSKPFMYEVSQMNPTLEYQDLRKYAIYSVLSI